MGIRARQPEPVPGSASMPRSRYARRIIASDAATSAATWSRVQKMCASFSWIERTLVRPPSTGQFGPVHAAEFGDPERQLAVAVPGPEMIAWCGHRLGRSTTSSAPIRIGGYMPSR